MLNFLLFLSLFFSLLASAYCASCLLSCTWSLAGCQWADRCSPSGSANTCLLIFLADSRLCQGSSESEKEREGGRSVFMFATATRHVPLADQIVVRNLTSSISDYNCALLLDRVHSCHFIDSLYLFMRGEFSLPSSSFLALHTHIFSNSIVADLRLMYAKLAWACL